MTTFHLVAMKNTMTQQEFVGELVSVIRYHSTLGISSYDIPFSQSQAEKTVVESTGIGSHVPVEVLETNCPGYHTHPTSKKIKPEISQRSMADLEKAVSRCDACGLSKYRIRSVFGAGGPDAISVLIVGEWLECEQHADCSGLVFGLEEDAMVARMLEALQLARSVVYITNAVKCGLPKAMQPELQQAQRCGEYLCEQIALLKPRLIITMGPLALKALLHESKPLALVRGKLLEFQGQNGEKTPVLATFHPTFLLRNPDMKKAAWKDLQLAGRFLQIRKKE